MSLKTFGFKQISSKIKVLQVVFSSFIFLIIILIVGGIINFGGQIIKYGRFASSVKKIFFIVNASGETKHFEDSWNELLGFSSPVTYLVVLMNKGEARPLGGFRGSFAKIKVASGKIQNIQIHDSYWLPSIKREYFCDSAVENIGFSKCVSFVDSARIGFTDYDGKVVKDIYEKTFNGERLKGVIFLRSDLFEELIPNYENYHLMREFWNASSKVLEDKPNKNKYRKFINAFVRSYQRKIFKRAIELFIKNPISFEGKIYVYLPDLKQDFGNRQRPYLSGGFYWFDTDKSFTKGWLFVNRTVYLWENSVLKYIGEGGYLGSYTGENIHIRVIYGYDFSKQKKAKLYFDRLQQAMEINLSENIKYILGYYSYIKSLSHFYYPRDYFIVKSTLNENLNIGKWKASKVAYFLREMEFNSNSKKEFVVDLWLKQKKFLK